MFCKKKKKKKVDDLRGQVKKKCNGYHCVCITIYYSSKEFCNKGSKFLYR